MHAEHADPFWVGRLECPETHERGGDRISGGIDKFAQQVARRSARIDHSTSGVEQGTFCMRHQVDRLPDPIHVSLELGPIAAVRKIFRS